MTGKKTTELRRGWTTGACATGAAKAAFHALATGRFPDPVEISLPRGGTTSFALSRHSMNADTATASILKDAGDDPDVTHGALVEVSVQSLPSGKGIVFVAGTGVGTVTKPGLPIPPGEPAINPIPRQMMKQAIAEVSKTTGFAGDVKLTVSIENGEELAKKTLNGRLGIVGGLSILGTTGIVRPFSCAAWIASIHRGIDVARALNLSHVVGATGATSEQAVQNRYNLPETAYLDMGDFAGGLLKYLRHHPISYLTLAGGFAKFTKLAQGALDLHSARSRVDLGFLKDLLEDLGAPEDTCEAALQANTAKEVMDFSLAQGIDLCTPLAKKAKMAAQEILRDAPINVEVLIIDRNGRVAGEARFD